MLRDQATSTTRLQTREERLLPLAPRNLSGEGSVSQHSVFSWDLPPCGPCTGLKSSMILWPWTLKTLGDPEGTGDHGFSLKFNVKWVHLSVGVPMGLVFFC